MGENEGGGAWLSDTNIKALTFGFNYLGSSQMSVMSVCDACGMSPGEGMCLRPRMPGNSEDGENAMAISARFKSLSFSHRALEMTKTIFRGEE
jgi:hypothetical protein